MTILLNDPHFSHWTVVVLRSQLCRRWSDTKDETRRKWCRVFFLLLDDNDYERHFMETARIHLIYQPRCRQCSIRSLWKILAKIGFHGQTPCHHVYNYIHIYIYRYWHAEKWFEGKRIFPPPLRKWRRSLKYSSSEKVEKSVKQAE